MTSELRTSGGAVKLLPLKPSGKHRLQAATAPAQKDTFSTTDRTRVAEPKKSLHTARTDLPNSQFQAQMKRLKMMEHGSMGEKSGFFADLLEKRDGFSEKEKQQFDQKFSQDVLHNTSRQGLATSVSLAHRRSLRRYISDDTQPKQQREQARRLLIMAPEVTEGQLYKHQTNVLKEEQQFSAESSRDLSSVPESDRQILAQELKAGKRPGLKAALSESLLVEARNSDGDFQSFGQIKTSLKMLGTDPEYQVPSEVTDALASRASEQNKSAKPDKRSAIFLAEAIAASARPEEFSEHAHLVLHDNLLRDQTPILAAAKKQIASGDTRTLDMARSSISGKAAGEKQNYQKMKNYERSLALIQDNGNALREGDWKALEGLLRSGHHDAPATLGQLGKTTKGKAHESLLGVLNRGLETKDGSLLAHSSAKAINQFPDRLDAKTLKNLIAGGHVWGKEGNPLSASSIAASSDKLNNEDFHSVIDAAFQALPSKEPGVRLSGQHFLREHAEVLSDSEVQRLSKSEANSLLATNIAFKRLGSFEGEKREKELVRVLKENPLLHSAPSTTRRLIQMAQDKTISTSDTPAAAEIKKALNQHVKDIAGVHGIDDGAPKYNGADVIVIAMEGTGSHEPGRTRKIVNTARALREDSFDLTTLKGLTGTVEQASGIKNARWSGLTEGALKEITTKPEYLDNMQYRSYGSEELTAIHTQSVFDAPKSIKEWATKDTSDGVLAAAKDIETLMEQAKAEGRNPKVLLMGHSSGGKGVIELLEVLKAREITSPDGKLLGDTADIFLVDPVAEAHTTFLHSKLNDSRTYRDAAAGLLNLTNMPGAKVAARGISKLGPQDAGHIESPAGSLRLPNSYTGRAQVFYQRKDEHGVGFGGGIYGSEVLGGTNTTNQLISKDLPKNSEGKYQSHGALNYHHEVLEPLRSTFDRMLNIQR